MCDDETCHPVRRLSISVPEFALNIFVQRKEEVEKIFADNGFDYMHRGGDGTYGNKKELQLDEKLRQFIQKLFNNL
jgi:hypothetical protein